MTGLCKECQNLATMKISQRDNMTGAMNWIVDLCPAHFRDVPYLFKKHYIVERIE